MPSLFRAVVGRNSLTMDGMTPVLARIAVTVENDTERLLQRVDVLSTRWIAVDGLRLLAEKTRCLMVITSQRPFHRIRIPHCFEERPVFRAIIPQLEMHGLDMIVERKTVLDLTFPIVDGGGEGSRTRLKRRPLMR